MIRILVVEDSEMIAVLLKAIFEAEDDLRVIGHARDGLEAVKMTRELKPDLVTMDIQMPVMDGFDAIREIMASTPVPIVVVSSRADDEELNTSFRALQEGALAVIAKPKGLPEWQELVQTARAMASVKVALRKKRPATAPSRPTLPPPTLRKARDWEIVAMCSSTGGPKALTTILSQIPEDYPVPIVIVQHMSPGFMKGLTEWLDKKAPLTVKLAEQGETLQPNTVYFGPDDRHFLVRRNQNSLEASLTNTPHVNHFRPSGSILLHSVAEVCGGRGIGVVLTGMGADGADGLLELKKKGGHTLVQDEESSVVFGMPGAALKLGAVEKVVSLDDMGAYLSGLFRPRRLASRVASAP